MKNINSIFLTIFLLLLTSVFSSAYAVDQKGGLFINLTTDDTRAATKAIMFAHKKVLKRGYKPVAIWLNVRGINLADKNRQSHASIQDKLQAFIKDGGLVIACTPCSKAAGLTSADFIDDVKMGNPDLVLGLLFDPLIKTLSF